MDENTNIYDKNSQKRSMEIKYLAIISLLVIVVVSISGCTSSAGSTVTSDRDVILQAIASGE